jgi:predicted nucleic acid-binding protein
VADLLVDSDVLIDHLRGTFRLELPRRKVAHVSVVTRCELLAGKSVPEESVLRLLAPFRELTVDRPIAERAGRLRRHLDIRTPDALIAATALEHGLTLMTRNARHFRPVPGLRVVTPSTH